MEIAVNGVLIGVVATLTMDIWAVIAKHVLRLPTANWAMVGRWFGHMRRGTFVHRAISAADPVRNERLIGWLGHYMTGVIYGLTYLLIVGFALGAVPSLASAVGFGLVTLIFPWFIMQPAMGAGVFATRTPAPNVARFVNVSMHLAFGLGLYVGWVLIR